ncbi:MAG TPA: hypothetical protein VNR40_18240 [Steroidobacter sp.]|nr:hypothetical protein [Steroidobacter sp.]
MLTVSVTSILNGFAEPLYSAWRESVVRKLAGEPMGDLPRDAPIDAKAALEAAYLVDPDARVVSIVPPGGQGGAPGHYVVWVDDSRLGRSMSRPVLVHAQTGWINVSYQLPWYLKVLQLSQRLHDAVLPSALWPERVAQ